jgi:NADPH:quinone reductase-like Zn-dependent oxidoreductase
MKAIVAVKQGGVEVLELHEVPIPQPNENEVLIKIQSAGINPSDFKIRKNGGRPFPYILGSDVSGIIEKTGEGVSNFKVGDEVFAALNFEKMGGYAQYVATDKKYIAIKPKNITHDEAAAIPLAGLTAWQALFDHGQLQTGQKVLIHAAAGGVGLFAVQLAKWKGAFVYGTASKQNIDFLKNVGVDRVIDYNAEDFRAIAKDVDLVFDCVGSDSSVHHSAEVVKEGGSIISITRPANSTLIKDKNIYTLRFLYTPNGKQLGELATLMEEKKLNSEIAGVFNLQNTADAHTLLEKGHTRGKIILHPF